MGKPLVTFRADALPKSIRKNITNHALIEGAVSREWWGTQAASLQQNFARVIRQGIVNGEAPATMAARITGGIVNGEPIKGIMATSRAQARTLVKQSVTAAQNQTRLETLRANADVVKGVEQISTFDNRTTEICMAYSGGTWDLDGEPILGCSLPFNNGPPHHWNCRSVLVPITKSYEELGIKQRELLPGTRASMNGQVAADMSFDKWLKGQPKSIQIELLGHTKAAMFRSGNLALRDLVDQTGRTLSTHALSAQSTAAVAESTKSKIITTYVKDFQAQNGRRPTLAEFQEFAVSNLNMKAAQAKRWYNARLKNITAPPKPPVIKPIVKPNPYGATTKTGKLYAKYSEGISESAFRLYAEQTFGMKPDQAHRYWVRFVKDERKGANIQVKPAPTKPQGPAGSFHAGPGMDITKQSAFTADDFLSIMDNVEKSESTVLFQKFLEAHKQGTLLTDTQHLGTMGNMYKTSVQKEAKDFLLTTNSAPKQLLENLKPGELHSFYFKNKDLPNGFTYLQRNYVVVRIDDSAKVLAHNSAEWTAGIRGTIESVIKNPKLVTEHVKQILKEQSGKYKGNWSYTNPNGSLVNKLQYTTSSEVKARMSQIEWPKFVSGNTYLAYDRVKARAKVDFSRAFITWVHEMGHQVHSHGAFTRNVLTVYEKGLASNGKDFPAVFANVDACLRSGVTQYSQKLLVEWHAEHFVFWLLARDELKAMAPEIVAYFDDLIKVALTQGKMEYPGW